jgi:serine/threonine protein kinase
VAIDSWSVGCIFAEMVKLSPLFPGRSEIDELFHIFRMRGTPTEEIWPGISSLENYQSTFPMWPQQNMVQVLTRANSHHPGMCDEGLGLLEQLLIFDPINRLSCALAINHPYFDEDSY